MQTHWKQWVFLFKQTELIIQSRVKHKVEWCGKLSKKEKNNLEITKKRFILHTD